jgi:hypothetical protein
MPIKTTLVLFGLTIAMPAFADTWFLAGHEGGCSPIAMLVRVVPEAANIHAPDTFIALMRTQGREVTREAFSLPNGKAVAVKVPSLGLSPLFVDEQVCRRITK